MLAVAQADAGVLRTEVVGRDRSILDVVGKRIVRDLEVVAAKRSHQAKLVGGIDVENERAEAAEAVDGVVDDLGNGRLQAEIAAVAVDAGIVGEAFGVAAKAEGVVGLVEIAGAEHEFGLVIAFEAGAGNYVENSIGAVAEFRAVAAAIDFNIFHVFGIELRADVLRDRSVDDGNAVQQPAWSGGRRGCEACRG